MERREALRICEEAFLASRRLYTRETFDEASDRELWSTVADVRDLLIPKDREALLMLVDDLWEIPEEDPAFRLLAKADWKRWTNAHAVAWARDNYLHVLRLLRKRPSFVSNVDAAWLRGRAYAALGLEEAAECFFENNVHARPRELVAAGD